MQPPPQQRRFAACPRCIAFSQSSHYTQIKAKSLIGLGNIERLNNNYIKANIHHQQAVELLEKIAAQCDLAEAYFQWAITLQNNQCLPQSNDYFQEAIAIYEQIPAPRQVERLTLPRLKIRGILGSAT